MEKQYENDNDSITLTSKDESEKRESEMNEVKFKIINNIIELRDKINNFKQLSSEEKNIDKVKLLGELNIIKEYFKNIIGISKEYLKNSMGKIDDTELNKLNGFIDKEKTLINEIEKVDNELLSISMLIELFELDGFQNFGDIKTYLEEETIDGVEKYAKEMEKFNSNDIDKIGLMNKLSIHGEAKFEENKSISEGPILVIYPEAHYAGKILKNNYEAIINSQEYYNFLATEGVPYEEIIDKNIPIKPENIDKLFNNNEIALSSIAVEVILKEQIKTLGVESNDFFGIVKKIKKNNNKEKNKLILEYFKQKTEQGMTYGDFIKLNSNSDELNDFFKNIVIRYRNYFWLKNIQNTLIYGNNNGKNFVPIVCGTLHTKDLISQSKNMGFKGVIIFKPKAYNDKIEIGFIKSYLKYQNKD